VDVAHELAGIDQRLDSISRVPRIYFIRVVLNFPPGPFPNGHVWEFHRVKKKKNQTKPKNELLLLLTSSSSDNSTRNGSFRNIQRARDLAPKFFLQLLEGNKKNMVTKSREREKERGSCRRSCSLNLSGLSPFVGTIPIQAEWDGTTRVVQKITF